MCGIAGMMALGIGRKELHQDSARWLAEMMSALVHRGPDDSGIWLHPNHLAGLCHRRLSIVDLSERGHQPMFYADGELVIIFNGEIYNFREVRQVLERDGYKFHSDTDTEMVLAAVHRWGIRNALARFVGMFAFALWDNRQRKLYLARDRLGEKPLYLSCKDGILYFSSELKSLLRVPVLKTALNMGALWTYLKLGYIQEPLSVVDGIFKLQAGHFLTVTYGDSREITIPAGSVPAGASDSGSNYPESYWALRRGPDQGGSDAHPDVTMHLERLDSLLRNAVREQMQCDVPYGVLLSGGVDSSLLAAYMQSESERPIHTFTVRFDDPAFDEGEHALRIASHLGADHHELRLSENEIVKRVPALSSVLDEPTANASFFAARMISELARKDVKVCLSGDGGDEVFAGYNRYLLMQDIWSRVESIPAPVRRMVAGGLSLPGHGFWSALEGLRRPGAVLHGQSRLIRKIEKMQGILRAASVVQAYENLVTVCPQPGTLLVGDAAIDLRWPCGGELDALNDLIRWDLMSYLPGDNLAKLDRASMSASLEVRLPLLDHRIVEFGYGLPSALKVMHGETKWLLKQLLYKMLPENLVTRPKMGFTAPVEKWLCGPLREWSLDLLSDSLLVRDGYLKRAEIDRKLDKFRKRGRGVNEVWALCILHSWYEGLRL